MRFRRVVALQEGAKGVLCVVPKALCLACLLLATAQLSATAGWAQEHPSDRNPSLLLRSLQTATRTLESPGNSIKALAFSPGGILLAGGGVNGEVELWRVRSGGTLHTLKGRGEAINAVDFSSDGRRVASGNAGGEIVVWDVGSGRVITRLRDHTGSVTSVAYSPDGTFLASGSADREVKIRRATRGDPIITFEAHDKPISAVAFSPDSELIASGDFGGSILVWKPETGEIVYTANAHRRPVSDLEFSSDGRHLASSGIDGKVYMWLLAADAQPRLVGAHERPVMSLALSEPIGNDPLLNLIADSLSVSEILTEPASHVVSGDVGGMLKVWIAKTGEVANEVDRSPVAITAVAFSPDGLLLADASGEGVHVRSWIAELQIHKAYAIVAVQHPDLVRQQGEFETTADYVQRQLFALEKIKEIMESMGDADLTLEVPTMQIKLDISQVGRYDADSETFPITISGRSERVRIPLPEAVSFKANWQQAEVRALRILREGFTTVDTLNVTIAHPETGSLYPFGEHEAIGQVQELVIAAESALRDISGVGPSDGVTPRSSAVLPPPDLALEVAFSEPSGNGTLDAGETGLLTIRVRNRGAGEAQSVHTRLIAENDVPGLELGPADTLATLPASETALLSVPIRAANDVRDAMAYVRVELLESRSDEPASSAPVSFETVSAVFAERRRAACQGALSEAEASFYEALFDDAIATLNGCIFVGGFLAEEKEHAYTLLAKVHFKQGTRGEAEASLRELMKMTPDYRPDPLLEPPEFVALVEHVRNAMALEEASHPVKKAPPRGLDGSLPPEQNVVAPESVETPDLLQPTIDE